MSTSIDNRTILSADEIRVVARLVDAWLPEALVDEDEVSDGENNDDRVDRAVLRCLRARGLVTDDRLELAADLRPLADALADGSSSVEVERAGEDGAHRTVVLAGARTVVLTEAGAALWSLSVAGDTAIDVVSRLAGLDHLDSPAAIGEPFEVAAATHAAADDALMAGDDRAAVGLLTAAGVGESNARAWVEAVSHRRDAVALSRETGELRWVIDGDGGCWEVDVAADRDASVCTPARGPELRARVVALLEDVTEREPSWL